STWPPRTRAGSSSGPSRRSRRAGTASRARSRGRWCSFTPDGPAARGGASHHLGREPSSDPVAGAVAPAGPAGVPARGRVAVAHALGLVGGAEPGVVTAAPAVVAGPPEVPGPVGADDLVARPRRRAVRPVPVAAPVVLLDAGVGVLLLFHG